MNMPARAPVMPLAQTREEINATAAALRHFEPPRVSWRVFYL